MLGRGIDYAVARFPWTWKVVKRPVRRFFDSAAGTWDDRVEPDSAEYLMPLAAALRCVIRPPAHILDVGTGTGAAALFLVERYLEADVLGIDISPEMVARASTSSRC